jgi:hypothetical protein
MDFNTLAADAVLDASPKQLGDIKALASRAEDMKAEIDALEAALKDTKAELRLLLSRELPEAMDAAGLAEFKTTKGRTLKVKDDVHGSVPVANKAAFHEWLTAHGHGDLIKNVLSANLGRGQDNMAAAIADSIKEQFGVEVTQKQDVHAQTLGAFVREQVAAGHDLPGDLLSLHIGRIVEIK